MNKNITIKSLQNRLEEKFNYCKDKFGLNSKLCFEMPASHENANGMYDDKTNIVHINNKNFEHGEIFSLFHLLHEIRHAWQHKNGKWFIYYFEDDGKAYRFNKDGGSYFECFVKGRKDVLRELYLCNPNEIDANEFAINELRTMYKGSKAKLQEIGIISGNYNPPLRIFTKQKRRKLFDLFCEVVEETFKGNSLKQNMVYEEIERITAETIL